MSRLFKIGIFVVVAVAVGVIARSKSTGNTTVSDQANARVSVVADATGAAVSDSAAPMLEDELPPGLSVNARVAFIREIGGADTILSYHTKVFWPIASITKLMTGVVAEETIGENAKITLSKESLEVEGIAGNLKAGERYTAWDLIKAMFTVSSNDAAQSLARAYNKDDGFFVQKMNEKARELGMNDTTFADASGLSMINQSTAGDLYKLVLYVSSRYPDFWKITRNTRNTITDIISGKRQTLLNINKFSGTPSFVGGKTGHTPESGDNLISIFEYQGRQYMFLVFGAEDRFAETQKLVDWFTHNSIHE